MGLKLIINDKQPKPARSKESPRVDIPLIARLHRMGLDEIAEDVKVRSEFGEEKYGTPLRVSNGRDPLVDLYEELLDGVMYLQQFQMKHSQIKKLDYALPVLTRVMEDVRDILIKGE